MSVDTQTVKLTSDILDTAYKKSELTHLSLNKAKRFLDEKYNNVCQGLKINVLGVSLHNAKSRVETQTKICIQVVTDKGEKVHRWSHLKLPEVLVNTPKIRKSKYSNQYDDVDKESILNLDAMVVCASDLSKSAIHMCVGCVQRERKRLMKRDLKKNTVETAIDKEINNLMSEHENERIIIFNCNQIIEFGGGDCILPSRITCYCRHHKEKIGFCIYFVLRDHNGVVVATGLSPPILITDDHKSNAFKKNGRKRVKLEQQSALPPSPSLTSSSLTPPQSINESDLVTPVMAQQNEASVLVDYTSNNGIYKQPIIINKTIPSNVLGSQDLKNNTPVNTIQYSNGLDTNMTPLSPISSPEMNINYSQQATYTTITSTSSSAVNTSVQPTIPNYGITNNIVSPTGLHMNIKSEAGLVNEAHLNRFIPETQHQPQVLPMYNIPNTTAAVVNNQLIVDQNIVIPSNNITETMNTQQKLYNQNGYTINKMNQTLSGENAPYINRLIPNEGPLSGGIEVTVLGVNFIEGLVVVFGDTEAQTQYYSPSTLICILPPAQVPGPVPVAVKSYSFNIPIQNLMIFNYKNESDKQLMELALQVVGLRMTGKIDDARNIAMRIVSISDTAEDYSKQEMGVEGRTNVCTGLSNEDPILKSSISVLERYVMDLNIQNKPFNNNILEKNSLENEVIQCLASIISPDEPFEKEEINLATVAGQNLLHFAVLLNMTSLIKWLIALDIDINSADINGNTALHLATLMANELVVKILVNNGADVYCENCNGKTPLDLAYELNNESIIDVVENVINEELSEISSEEGTNSENEEIDDVQDKNKGMETANIENIDNSTKEIASRSVNYFKSNENKVKQRRSQQNLNLNKNNKNLFEKEYYSSEVETDIYDAKPIEPNINRFSNTLNDMKSLDSNSKIISPEVAVNKITSKYKLLQKDLPQYAMSFFSAKDKNTSQTKSEISWFQNIQQMPNFMNFSTITAFNFSFTNPFPLVTQHWNDLRKKQFEEWRRNQSLYTLLKRDSSAVIVNDDMEEGKKKNKINELNKTESDTSKKSINKYYMKFHCKKENKENDVEEEEEENNSIEENEEVFFEDYDDYDYDEYIENGLFENDPRLTDRERRLLAKQKHSLENRKRLRRDRTLFLFWIPTILVMVALALLRVYTFRKILLETVNTLVLVPLGLEPYEIITVNHDQDLADIIDKI